MSLIADALKKAQAAKLGRRYLTLDPGAVVSGGREGGRSGGGLFPQFVLDRLSLSPALLIGLISGVLFFVFLFAYFLYGRNPEAKSSVSAASPASKNRPVVSTLTPPPSIPGVEPLVLEKEGLAAKSPAGAQKSPALEGAAGEPQVAKAQAAKVEEEAPDSAPTREPEGRNRSAKVAVTPTLSDEVRYHFNLALSYHEERNFHFARREYERAVQLWPFYAEAHNNLGVVYKELGMHDQAIGEFRTAVALNPRYPRAYHNLGVIYQLREDWKQATKNYELAISLDRNHLTSYNNLGLVLRSQKRPYEARELLEKALTIHPYFPETHYNLALVLEEIGEIERARVHYQKFIDNAGEEKSGLAAKVRTYLKERLGNHQLAVGSAPPAHSGP